VGGIKIICPSGVYGGSKMLSTPFCSGPCHEGYFCPAGSVSNTEREVRKNVSQILSQFASNY
jgi:hypothetical protein